jgi:hypothetical protein
VTGVSWTPECRRMTADGGRPVQHTLIDTKYEANSYALRTYVLKSCADPPAASAAARKVLGWPKRCKLAHAFLWEYSYKRLKLAQLLGQLGVFLTCRHDIRSSRSCCANVCAPPQGSGGTTRGSAPPMLGASLLIGATAAVAAARTARSPSAAAALSCFALSCSLVVSPLQHTVRPEYAGTLAVRRRTWRLARSDNRTATRAASHSRSATLRRFGPQTRCPR